MIVSPRPGQSPWNPLNMSKGEWGSITGIRKPITTTISSGTSGEYLNYNSELKYLTQTDWEAGNIVGNYNAYLSVNDSYLGSPLNQSHGSNRFLAMSHSTSNGQLVNFPPGQNNFAFSNGSGMAFSYNNIYSDIDGLWPGDGLPPGNGNPSVIEYCYFHGPGLGNTWYGLPLAPDNINPVTTIGLDGTTGSNMTEAQMESVTAVAPNTYYEAGSFISTNAGLYQVATPGTSGSGNLTQNSITAPYYEFWPGGTYGVSATPFYLLSSDSTDQPFAAAGSTFELVYIGTYQHADGIQMGRTEPVTIRRTKVEGFSNSCTFIQSSAAAYGEPSDWPAGPITITECDYQAGSNCWIYVNTNAVDPNFAGAMPGRWLRSNSSASWSAFSTPWFGRPEMITITDNLMRNRLIDGLSPKVQAGGYLNFGGFINMTENDPNLAKYSYSQLKVDYPAFVPDQATRNAGIVNQFNSDGTINTAVLEERFQNGLYPGSCDARSWIVLARNFAEDGTELFPQYGSRTNVTINGNLVFDSNGYYVGN